MTMYKGTRGGDSTLPRQDAMKESKRTRGRGAYDYGESSAARTSPFITDRRDLSLALALHPFQEIHKGFVIPHVSPDVASDVHFDESADATTVYYHLIGDPYKRNADREGAASLVVPAQLLGLVEDLHEESAASALMEQKVRRDLWNRYSRRTATQATSACWKEECVALHTKDGKSNVHTKASLWVKEEDGLQYSRVGPEYYLFPGTPKSALRRRWGRSEAGQGQNSIPHQSSSGTA